MSGRLYSQKTEQALLLCALETRSQEIRNLILANTLPEDFGTEWGEEARTRIDQLLRLGKPLGSAVDFSEDPGLTDATREFVLATPERRKESRSLDEDRVQHLLQILKTHRKRRILYDGVSFISDAASGKFSEKDLQRIELRLENMLFGIRQGDERDPILHLGKGADPGRAKEVIKKILSPSEGKFLSTGISAFDKHLHGWERGNLVTLSAPRSGGKSMVSLALAIDQYMKNNLSVCYVSLEMTEIEVVSRLLANISNTFHGDVRNPKAITKKKRALLYQEYKEFLRLGRKNNCRFSIRDVKDTEYTPYKMEAELAPLEFDIIYIDYITLFNSRGQDTWKAQFEYSKYLKTLAKKLGCVIVALTQLSDEERVKYGKSVEENTDYWIWWNWDPQSKELGETTLNLDKARHAPDGVRFRTRFNFPMMQISVYGREDTPYGGGGYGKRKNGKSSAEIPPAPLSYDDAERAW